jgi:hypothetical protein
LEELQAHYRRLGAEGLILKRATGSYRSGVKGQDWMKIKFYRDLEVPVEAVVRKPPYNRKAAIVTLPNSRRMDIASAENNLLEQLTPGCIVNITFLDIGKQSLREPVIRAIVAHPTEPHFSQTKANMRESWKQSGIIAELQAAVSR